LPLDDGSSRRWAAAPPTSPTSRYLRLRWETSTEDADRTEIIEAAIPNVQRQLELVHARQRSLADFEAELTDKLARMRERLADLEKHSPVP
jgi:hypothetical protein